MSTQPTEAHYAFLDAICVAQNDSRTKAAQLIADSEARAVAAEREKVRVLRVAMVFIMKCGGMNIDTDLGEILCNGSWCAEQARAALDATKEARK